MKTMYQASFMAIAVAAFAMACADPAGLDRTLMPGSPTLDVTVNPATVNTLLPGDISAPGRVRVCKQTPTGDPALAWTFTIQVTSQIGAAPPAAVTWDGSITGVAGQTVCETAFVSTKPGDGLDRVIITEQALPANWSLLHIHIDRFMHGAGPYVPPAGTPIDVGVLATRQATLYVNGDMLRDVTFGNDFSAPPPPICTYTKGWYQNKNGAPTVVAVDGRTKLEAQTILASTPSTNPDKNLGVTWGDDNLLHNLYQQLLAALLNLGLNATAGPDAVDAAIASALAGTGGTGLNITTTLTHDQMAALVETLSSFNEGEFAGYPHCAD